MQYAHIFKNKHIFLEIYNIMPTNFMTSSEQTALLESLVGLSLMCHHNFGEL